MQCVNLLESVSVVMARDNGMSNGDDDGNDGMSNGDNDGNGRWF